MFPLTIRGSCVVLILTRMILSGKTPTCDDCWRAVNIICRNIYDILAVMQGAQGLREESQKKRWYRFLRMCHCHHVASFITMIKVMVVAWNAPSNTVIHVVFNPSCMRRDIGFIKGRYNSADIIMAYLSDVDMLSEPMPQEFSSLLTSQSNHFQSPAFCFNWVAVMEPTSSSETCGGWSQFTMNQVIFCMPSLSYCCS